MKQSSELGLSLTLHFTTWNKDEAKMGTVLPAAILF